MNDFTTTFTVDRSAQEAFDAFTNVRGWWSQEIRGGTAAEGDEFHYHYRDVHSCTMRLTEVVPGRKVVWRVLDNDFNFIEDKTEWVGTEVTFEAVERDGGTEVRFAHLGLVPEYECYAICSNEWGKYVNGSLRNLIVTGQGQPNPKE